MGDMAAPVKSVPLSSTSSPNPVSQFEDSPIFNYINNLSPIKPLNSEQSFNLLGFASPKTLVTLPATNCLQKSKITRKRQAIADDLQPMELHAGEVHYRDSHVGITTNELLESTLDACQSTKADLGISSDGKQDYLDSGVVLKVASAPDEQAELSTELHDCISSDHGGYDSKSDAVEYNSVSQMVDSETCPEHFIQENSENIETYFDSNLALQEVHVGQTKAVGCRSEKMLVEAADQLLCDSPINERDAKETDNIYVDSGTLSFLEDILQLSQENIPLGFSEHDGAERHNEAGQASTSPQGADKAVPNTSAEVDNKPCPQQQQIFPRRCLVFEMSGTQYRKLMSDTGGTSFTSERSACTAVASERRLVSRKCEVYNFSSLQPDIGLHLNNLATTRRDTIIVKQELTAYKRQLIDMPCMTSSLHSTSSNPEPIDPLLDLNPLGEDLEPSISKGKLNENACQSLALTGSDKLKQNSTKRKRRKSETEEGDTCKRCNCKRSKCLKLYCECFAAGLYCVEPCACQGCLNRLAFEETVLETRRLIEARNPLAFAPKVITIPDASEYGDDINSTPASARHKRGCNCKRSGCLKKYCECFQGGVGCSLSCRCEGCKNSFGRKDGSDNIMLEETEAIEDNSADVSFPEIVVKDDMEHQDPQLQVTPCFQICRNPSGPVGSASKFPSFSSGLLQPCTRHGLERKTSSFSHNYRLEEETAKEFKEDNDNDALTSARLKSMSSNHKRISPHLGLGQSPVIKFGRKLILRSIPSFPKLSEHRENGMSQGKPS